MGNSRSLRIQTKRPQLACAQLGSISRSLSKPEPNRRYLVTKAQAIQIGVQHVATKKLEPRLQVQAAAQLVLCSVRVSQVRVFLLVQRVLSGPALS